MHVFFRVDKENRGKCHILRVGIHTDTTKKNLFWTTKIHPEKIRIKQNQKGGNGVIINNSFRKND